MRFSISVACIGLAASWMIACGDDPPPVEVDPPCLGHGCLGLKPEGGEIRVENLFFPYGIGFAGGSALFYKNQVPENQKFPELDKCTAVRTTPIFPAGSVMFPADKEPMRRPDVYTVTRDSVDVGSKITFVSTRMGKTFEMAKQVDGVDWQQRFIPIFYQDLSKFMSFPPEGYDYEAVGGPGLDTRVDLQVTIEGNAAANIPKTVYAGGIKSDKPGISIPERPVMVTTMVGGNAIPILGTQANTPPCMPPDMCAGPAGFPVQRDVDFTVSWTPPTKDSEAGATARDGMIAFLAFGDMAGPVLSCITEAQRGTFTVSKEDVALLPEMGLMFMGYSYHRLNEMDGRRIDMIGTTCSSGFFQKIPPP